MTDYITKEQAIEIGHRRAWRYAHSRDPHHSSTYTFNDHCLHEFANAVIAKFIEDSVSELTGEPYKIPVGASHE